MTPFSLGLLSIAALLTVLYVPMVIAVAAATGPNAAGSAIGILFLALLRFGVLLAGFVTAVSTGRMDALATTTSGQMTISVIVILLVEVAANWILFGVLDASGGGPVLPVFGLAASVALPGMLVAAAFCGLLGGSVMRQQWVGPLFWGSLIASVACWMLVTGIANARKMERQEKFAAERRQEEEQKQQAEDLELQRTKAEIEQTPPDNVGGLEKLLAYTATWQRRDLSDLAVARIQTDPQRVARLAGMLSDGKTRLEALGVLAREAGSLPAEVEAKCWSTVETFAREFLGELRGRQTDPELDSLFRPVLTLMDADPTARTRRRRELLAVQKVVKEADRQHKIFSLEAMMRLRDIDHPQGQWAEPSSSPTTATR